MLGTRCVNCRWWNGDREFASYETVRHGDCKRITAKEDVLARLYPMGTRAWLKTRFDFECSLWERLPKPSKDEVTIPRAQYEALMAAAKAIPLAIRLPRPWLPGGADAVKDNEAWEKIDAALAALRAAGIQELVGGGTHGPRAPEQG